MHDSDISAEMDNHRDLSPPAHPGGRSAPPQPFPIRLEPYGLLAAITFTIFLIELLIMVVFQHLPHMPEYLAALCDALLLPALVFPTLYHLLYKPLKQCVLFKEQAEREKDLLIQDLRAALSEVRALEGILPICASCKKIRDDRGYWHMVEAYISAHSEARFSHGICPECAEKLYPDISNDLKSPNP